MKKFDVGAFILILALIFGNVRIAYAIGVGDGGHDSYEYLKDGELLEVKQNGIHLTNYDKIATTGIRYRTIGYTVKSEDKKKSVIVPLTSVASLKHEDDPLVKEGYVLSVDKIDIAILYDQIEKAYPDWAAELYDKGANVYLDGVMTINRYGNIQGSLQQSDGKYVGIGRVYTTAQAIKDAEQWKDRSSLDTHFNKKVYLDPITTNIGFIDAALTATANPGIIQQGVTSSVDVTLDSSESRARLKVLGLPMKDAEISSRRFWVLSDGVYKEVAQKEGKVTIHVDNVTSQSVLTCRVRVYSQEMDALDDENVEYQDEETVLIYLGQQGTSNATCNLNADNRGSEKFNVLQGIPTTETLYANIKTEEYLVDFQSTQVIGERTYSISVSKSYNLQWQENGVNRTAVETVTKEYKDITRPYKYHIINTMAVYGVDKAVINNACLPGGSVTITPNSYTLPFVDVLNSKNIIDHIKDPEYENVTLPSTPVYGGTSRPSVPNVSDDAWRADAEKAIGNIQVRNDRFIIGDYTILDDRWVPTNSIDLNELPKADLVESNVLYKSGLKIDAKTLNGDYHSTGSVYYSVFKSVNSTQTQRVEGIRVNNVIIHTPVVCDPTITNDSAHNQEIKADSTRAAMILGRPTQLTFPTIGKYINKKGYVGADYRKYTQDRIVKFPFDVYIKGEFYKAGKEYHMLAGEDTIDLKLPTWVDEGNYGVECRSIAINSPGNANLKQDLANISYANYIATKTIPVRVIGRIYGLKITDINDYPDWAQVFRTDTKSTKHSDNYYWVGDLNEEGQARGNTDKFTLPILNGSHTEKSNLGVLKTGYKIRFDLTTIGNYFKDADCVRIKPKFYYVKKDGSSRQEVDLWYTEKINGVDSLIKVGSKTDAKNIKSIVLGDPYRNVPDDELANTSKIIGITKNEFSNQKAKIGAYGDVILSKPIRTFIGDTSSIPNGVDENRVRESVQKWYGEYSIPNNVYVSKNNFDVVSSMGKAGFTGKEKFWLKNGYIIVNFEIETIKNGDGNNPQLSYWKNPNCNMWKLEGFNYTKKDSSGANFSLQDGDVVFYYTDKKSSDDYSSGGTN